MLETLKSKSVFDRFEPGISGGSFSSRGSKAVEGVSGKVMK